MNKSELIKLQSINSYPSVSILMPTHRHHPENQQDKIRLKNLISEAEKRLLSEFKKSEIRSLLEKLHKVVDRIDFQYLSDGLAIFMNNYFGSHYCLNFPLKERMLIDKNFAIRDIVFAINRSQPYLILIISDKIIRLFTSVRKELTEITDSGFPFKNKFYISEKDNLSESENDRIIPNIEHERIYLREADNLLKDVITNEQISIAILAVTQKISLFSEISNYSDNIVVAINGNYEHSNIQDISEMVWSEMKKAFAFRREKVLKELEKAIGINKYATGIDEVWKLAMEGRGKILLTEINFHYTARIDDSGLQLFPSEIESGPEVMDDAVDEIIETVIKKGGEVVFYDNDKLLKYDRIAMILRY